jgi:hypothetical protein
MKFMLNYKLAFDFVTVGFLHRNERPLIGLDSWHSYNLNFGEDKQAYRFFPELPFLKKRVYIFFLPHQTILSLSTK